MYSNINLYQKKQITYILIYNTTHNNNKIQSKINNKYIQIYHILSYFKINITKKILPTKNPPNININNNKKNNPLKK